MKSNYRRLGDYIRPYEQFNDNMEVKELLGINNNKYFQQSQTNTIGIDLRTYRVVRKNQFAYNRATTRNGDKISIALREENDCIVSPSYRVFETTDANVLHPEYLMMWFRRPEFDRYARFKSHGSAHEFFEYEDMCEVTLPIPSITKQMAIIREYNLLANRIKLNNSFIEKLEEAAKAIYKQWFIDFEFSDQDGKPYKSSGGAMEFNETVDKEIPVGWRVGPLRSVCTKIGSGATPRGGKESYHSKGISLIRSLNVHDFIFSPDSIAYIDENQASRLKNVIVEEDDILLNITGVSVARCCKVPSFVLPSRVNQHVMIIRPVKQLFLSHYLLCLLCYSDNKSKLLGISQSGSTREAITKQEVEDFEIIIPEEKVVKYFDHKLRAIIQMIENKVLQNDKLDHLISLLLSRLATMEDSP